LVFECTEHRPGVLNTSAACGPRGHFVRLAMLFAKFQIINIEII